MTVWLALGVFASVLTLLYLVVTPRQRVYFTSGFAGIAWLTMAFTAPGVQRMTESGEVVTAGLGIPIQYFVGLLGLLSLTVTILYRLGEYPPPEKEANP